MDECVQPGLLPLHEAMVRIIDALQPMRATETLPLADCLDRVLAENIIAPINVPGGDNSAMDGYAVRHQDCNVELSLIGESLAGHPYSGELADGQAVRIMTGALLPAGADVVVMQENVTRVGNKIRIDKLPEKGENIRRAGEDIEKHTAVLPVGHLLSALDIGLLASLGIYRINVFQRVKVALLTTGDELLPAGAEYQAGKIYDSNRPLLTALLKRLPVELMDAGIIADEPAALRAAFLSAQNVADLVISTGGVSVGDADYTREILTELGEINFWKIAMKPGKPFAFGILGKNSRKNDCWFCGLPGNPVSTAATYHQLVVPALRYLAGEKPAEPLVITAVATKALKKQPGRMDFQRGIFSCVNNVNLVESSGSQSSGVLSSMNKANCYIRLEAGRGPVAAGETVDVILFDRFIR